MEYNLKINVYPQEDAVFWPKALIHKYRETPIRVLFLQDQRQRDLLTFVQGKHKDQLRKDGSPYINHLLEVAALCAAYAEQPLIQEIALCHDLLEDTDILRGEFEEVLCTIGYSVKEAREIYLDANLLDCTVISKSYPREFRKRQYAGILGWASNRVQNVKLADIISNFKDTSCLKPDFLEMYRGEKKYLLSKLTNGNPYLFKLAAELVIGSLTDDASCKEWCGENHCDTNGCNNRTRHHTPSDMLIEPAPVTGKDSLKVGEWIQYSPGNKIPCGLYLVCRKDGKIHKETFNGTGWAYNDKVIMYYASIFNPITNKYEV